MALSPDDREIQLMMADAMLHLDKLEEAVALYQKIIESRPNTSIAYHKLAIALSRLGKLTEADKYYSQLFQRRPDFASHNFYDFSVQRQSGDFFFRQQDWLQAIAAYQRAIELQPRACWEHINLGRSLAKVDRYDEAIAALKQAVEIDDFNGWGHYHLSEILFEQAQLQDALVACRRSALLMPNHLGSKTLMANINSRINHLEATRAEVAHPEGIEQSARQSNAAEQTVNEPDPPAPSPPAAATESRAEHISVSPTIEAIPGWNENYELGKQLQVQGNLEAATKAYYQSVIKNPYHSWSYHDLGDVNLKLGNWHEAIASYQQAIRLNPSYFWSNYNLGLAYKNVGDWKSTIALYLRAAELNPGMNLPIKALEETLEGWYNSLVAEGDQYLQTNRDKALSYYRQAIETYRDNIFLQPFNIPRPKKTALRVLLIVDDHLGQCLRYRVNQKIEQLEAAGFEATYYSWTSITEAQNKIAFFDVVIFYRTPAFPGVIRAIKYAKMAKKVVFYEIDDLIFDSDLFPEPIESYGGQVSQEQYDGLVKGTVLFQEAMRTCDMAIASTPPLLRQMEKVVGEGNCYLHRNALDSNNHKALAVTSPKVKRDYLSIFYGSGTKAHNSDFNELVAPALARILEQHSHVRLTLMGYLTVPDILTPYQERIDRVDIVKDIAVYYEFLKQADISLAVLHPTTVNNCKSELKWFEAASFKIPSVVSNTEVYTESVAHGKDGYIAANAEEWFDCLDLLVNSEALRREIGGNAYKRVMQQYSVPTMAKNIRNIIHEGVDRLGDRGDIITKPARKKLLIVNVFYPPQSIGGATRIVRDNVDVLTSDYSDQYDVCVFTTDHDNQEPYQITEYSHGSVSVTKVSTPMMEGMDWQYQNPRMYEIFKTYLAVTQPDLIHFHCIQRITASALEAAYDLNIPYLVTAHDAWWISDHQFLVNEQGQECSYQQNDPIITAADTRNLTESMRRKLYLRKQLDNAAEILAVSETFADIYRQNGFPQTKANRNGIQLKTVPPAVPSKTGRVRLAHIGGMAAHKGYFLFKEAVEKAALSNTEVIVVNHAQSPGTKEYGDWSGTPVTFLAKFKQEKINDLYSMIDVLMAPSMWPESFGLVTREATAVGVWVVTSDKGAIGEDIVPNENGHICSVDSPDSLIRILKEIDQKPEHIFDREKIASSRIRLTTDQVAEMVTFYEKVSAEVGSQRP